jgi:hypothetical protein
MKQENCGAAFASVGSLLMRRPRPMSADVNPETVTTFDPFAVVIPEAPERMNGNAIGDERI